MKRLVAVAWLLSSCSKSPPNPFGSVDDKLSDWLSECETGVVQQPFVKVGGIRLRQDPFKSATTQHKCGPPGWSLYTDASRKIVGICVDDRAATFDGTDVTPRVKHIDLARELFSRRFGSKFTQEVTDGKCYHQPERVPHSLLRWSQDPSREVGPDGKLLYPTTGTLSACCWEVVED